MSESKALPDRPIRYGGSLRGAIESALGFSEEWGRPSVLYPGHEQTWLIEPADDHTKEVMASKTILCPCSVFLYDKERNFSGIIYKGDCNA